MNPKLPKRRAIRKKALTEMLNDPKWQQTYEFPIPNYVTNYAHDDGEMLIRFADGTGVLYTSHADFLTWRAYLETLRNTQPQHVLTGLLPQGEHFIDHIPQLLDRLAEKFKIPREALDGSIEGLRLVDEVIRKRGKKKCLTPEIFPMLVAVAGEHMRAQTNGRWEMRPGRTALGDPTIVTWEPWVIDPQQRVMNPWLWLYDDLYEPGPAAISGSVSVRISTRRVEPPPSQQPIAVTVVMKGKPLES
ncbi:MAG: hypothetical protein H7Y11_07375 [Armatimonadetes bacterium]|nr:hypothetical protein [Anaerolineae bacterium]